MNLAQRKLLMGGLLACFAVQTALVYSDDTADSFSTLNEEAVRGRQLWHDHNCQVCHQIHGFGGFLGPDLTNAAKRLTEERFDVVLTVGTEQMPAFHFDEDQRLDIIAFLDQLSDMGIGVPRRNKPLDPSEVRSSIVRRLAEASAPEEVQRGANLFTQNCSACHVPLQATPLGLQTAPDLTTAPDRLDDKALRETIQDGRPERGMQAWEHLGEQAIGDLIAFVKWLHADREALLEKAGGSASSQPLPWWEYK